MLFRKISLFVAAGVLAAGFAGSAFAQDEALRQDKPTPNVARQTHPNSNFSIASAEVTFADLDLATPDGDTALYFRLSHAARRICYEGVGESLTMIKIERACYRDAMNRAIDKIGNDGLSKLHRTRDSWAGSPRDKLLPSLD